MIHYLAPESADKQRLDVFLFEHMKQLSRASVQKLCEAGKVAVNTNPQKPGYKLKTHDRIAVDYDLTLAKKIPRTTLPVVYEDNDCIVINKPVGLLTHSKGSFNPEATVASFIQKKVRGLSGERVGIVHRLDRGTSGVIICAKHEAALGWLQKQFSQRKVKKTYIAVIEGSLDPPEAVIEMPIGRNPKKPQSFRVDASGKYAVTVYKQLTSNKTFNLVQLTPQTGRTHQLRVHLAALKHPIVGDVLYGGISAERLFLHAKSLELTLPSKERKIFRAPVPAEFHDKL